MWGGRVHTCCVKKVQSPDDFFTPFGPSPPPPPSPMAAVNDNNYLGITLTVVGVEEPSARRAIKTWKTFVFIVLAGTSARRRMPLPRRRVYGEGRRNPPVAGDPGVYIRPRLMGGGGSSWR